MPDPLQTFNDYRAQSNRRALWFLGATAAGLFAALVLAYFTDSEYPPWRTGAVVHGLIFWPWYFLRGGKNAVTMRQAIKAYREMKKQ